MKSTFKALGASVLALSLAFCSYGAEWGAAFLRYAAFKPMVGKDVKYALGVNLDKDQIFKVVDACIAELVKVLKDEEANSPDFDKGNGSELKGKVIAIREQVAACKNDPFQYAPKDLRALLDESGLRNPEIYWGVLALEDFKIMDNQPQFKGLSLSIAGKVDLEKLISALQREFGSDLNFEKTMLEGERTWHVVSSDSSFARDLRKARIDPYVTSLDGRLLLVAGSRETLVKQILLYRKGESKGDLLHGFSAADGEYAHLHLSGVGDMLWQYGLPRMMRDLASELENGKGILLGLKDLVLDVKARSDGSLWGSAQLGTASSKDADQLRTFAKNKLPLAGKALKVPACVKKMIEEVEIGGEMDRFEIGNVDLFSLALGAFVPAMTSARLNAQKSKAVEAVFNARTALECLYVKKDNTWPPAILNARTHEGGYHVMDENVAKELFRNGLLNVDCKKTSDAEGLNAYTLRGVDRFGIADPWAQDVLRKLAEGGDRTSTVPSGGKVEDHLIYFAVDQNDDGFVDRSEGAPVNKVRAQVIIWCAGADGGLGDCSTDRRSKTSVNGRTVSNGDNVYSWQRDQEVQ